MNIKNKFILIVLFSTILILGIMEKYGYDLSFYFSIFFFGMSFMSFVYEFMFNKENETRKRKTKNKTISNNR